jgi:hypothetical protein
MCLALTPAQRRGPSGERETALDGVPNSSSQFLCENRKLCYLWLGVGNENAPCEAAYGEEKDEEKIFIWNRRNALISHDSGE